MFALKLTLVVIAVGLAIVSGLPDYGDPVERGTRRFKTRRFLWIGLSVLFLAGGIGTELLSNANERAAEHERRREAQRYLEEIANLKSAIATEQAAHRRASQQALDALDRLQRRLTDLQSRAETEDLRDELSKYQTELRLAQRKLAPPPKARLTWVVVSEQDAERNLDPPIAKEYGDVTQMDLVLENHSAADARDVTYWIRICEGCVLAATPPFLQQVPSGKPGEYGGHVRLIATQSQIGPIRLQMKLPRRNAAQVGVRVKYSCVTCVAEPDREILATIESGFSMFRGK